MELYGSNDGLPMWPGLGAEGAGLFLSGSAADTHSK